MEVVTTTQIGLSGMPTFTRQKTANSHQGASNLSLSGQLSSQNSVSCNERLSRQSSTRGDQQAADGLLRKQRVAHYMQMERERAARARLERDEHSEWVNLRSLERAEIIKYLTDAEISELLHREAREVERVRLETEEVVKRGAEAALERRRSTTSMHLKVEKASLIHEIGGTDVSPGSVRMEGSESEGLTASTRTSTRCGPERSSERMGDVIVKLYRAQEDVIALKNTIKGIKYAQRVAEDKACREAERAEIEVGERMKAEALVRSYEKKVDELRKKISTLEERLESAKEKINSYAVAREEMTLLSAAKEQVKSLENENKELRERYNLLCSERNELLAKVAVESRRGETGSDLSPAAFSGHEAHLPASTLGRTSTSVGMDIFQGCATEDIQSLQREVEHHRNQLEAVTNDNAKLKAKLQLAIASKKKYEGIAQKIIKEKGSLPSREEYERLQREARRFKKSADEVRKELKSHRECSAREIS
ncbi:hypothetical protein TRVL_08086 [Trypanosoma vivax]|nr:hypothetical protein TRVL_08086 [Trypanosoma vivax]